MRQWDSEEIWEVSKDWNRIIKRIPLKKFECPCCCINFKDKNSLLIHFKRDFVCILCKNIFCEQYRSNKIINSKQIYKGLCINCDDKQKQSIGYHYDITHLFNRIDNNFNRMNNKMDDWLKDE